MLEAQQQEAVFSVQLDPLMIELNYGWIYYANLTTDIRNYTEVDANVFTAAVINRFLENAEHRINLDIPMLSLIHIS